MILQRFYDDKLAQASFLIGCPGAGEALVLDPHRDVEMYLRAAAAQKLRITAVTETHIHADFVSGARELAQRTGATAYLSDEGAPDWSYAWAKEPGVMRVREGDVIRVGRVRLDVLRTAGHTPEHISFLLTDEAASPEPLGMFTGDFVFVGDVGRPDLLERAAHHTGTMERSAHELFHSLRRLDAMPGHLMLWPGHGSGSACGKNLGGLPVTTLQYERTTNWGLRESGEEAFVSSVLAGQPEPPAYFAHMKRINQQGPPVLGGFRLPPELPGHQVMALVDHGHVLVDLRGSSAWAGGAIPGALHIPMGPLFTNWAGWLLPYDRPIHLLATHADQVAAGVRDLAMIGIDEVAGWFGPDALESWRSARGTLARTESISAAHALERLARGEIRLVDVRGHGEYEAGHVPGATHAMLGRLADASAAWPREQPVAVHCQGGVRSPIAASLLRRAGFAQVLDVEGGFAEHVRQGLPVETGVAAQPAP